jgi:hypothetical protein
MLLYDADRVLPKREGIEEAARRLLPAGFPWKDDAQAGRLWIFWANRIVPAGAEFLPPGDPAWKKVTDAPWNDGTIALRTRNLLFFSRSHDLEAVSGCIRNGEGAIRALDRLLNGGRPSGRSDRLEVRLHRNRKDFDAEAGPDAEFLAGYYAPSERVSRFYVPEADSGTLLGRALNEVLSHELTHQYVEERWVSGDRSETNAPGYWLVEGIARFVEDQALEMGRRGIRFDDSTVSSLDCAAALARKRQLFPLERLLRISQADFARLDEEPRVSVALKHTIAEYELSDSNIFYEQSGSLVFFLLNRAGEAPRAAFVRTLRSYYEGKPTPPTGEQLGYASTAELEKAFLEFLRTGV